MEHLHKDNIWTRRMETLLLRATMKRTVHLIPDLTLEESFYAESLGSKVIFTFWYEDHNRSSSVETEIFKLPEEWKLELYHKAVDEHGDIEIIKHTLNWQNGKFFVFLECIDSESKRHRIGLMKNDEESVPVERSIIIK